LFSSSFFFQAEDGIRDATVTGVQTCALPISRPRSRQFSFLSLPPGKRFPLAAVARRRLRALLVKQCPLCRLPHSLTKQVLRTMRSEDRRVGKECRYGWSSYR